MTIGTILVLALSLAGVPAAASDRPGDGAPAEAHRASAAAASASAETHGAPAEALGIARESRAAWSLGRLTVRERRGRPPRVHADLLNDGTVVGRLRIDPGTGGFLARRERGGTPAGSLDLTGLQAAAGRALAEVEIGGWAWPTRRGRAWGVPLLYRGRVVGSVAVDVRGGRLLPRDDEGEDNDEDDD